MKKFLAIFALLLGAATGSYSGEWNGAGSTSGSGFTAGQDVTAGAGTFDHVKTTGSAGVEVATGAFSVGGSTIDARGGTVKLASTTVTGTLTVLGTAPSLTATGGVLSSSLSVVSPGDAGQIGAVTIVNNTGSLGQQIKFRHPIASSIKTFGYDNNYGAFLFSDNDAGDSTTATSFFQVTRLGRMRIGDAASYLSYPVPGARMHVTSTGSLAGVLIDGAATSPLTVGVSTLVVRGDTGNVGIGTASPLAKLSVVGNSSFSQPATFLSSVTVGGASENYLGVGDDTQYATNGQSGLKVTDYSDSQLYIDHKTGSGGAAYFRSGAGAEAGSARTWMTVNTGTAKVSISAGPLALYSRTIAQLLAITPAATGEMYFCNNCSPLKVVVSTGTGAGNFADAIGGAFQ